jgi:hypothetical protein
LACDFDGCRAGGVPDEQKSSTVSGAQKTWLLGRRQAMKPNTGKPDGEEMSRPVRRIWRVCPPRILVLVFACLSLYGNPAQAAVIDFTSGTVECSFGSLDPFINYREHGVTITSAFYVFRGGANVTCPPGFPDAFRPALPWPDGISAFNGFVSISATSELTRIATDGWGDGDHDGWIDMYAWNDFGPLCSISGCPQYPTNAVRVPAGERVFDLAGRDWTHVVITGAYGFPIGINTIETIEAVPEPAVVVLTGLGMTTLAVRRRLWSLRRSRRGMVARE